MKVHFIRHIFATLTYDRNLGTSDELWSRCSKDFNRFVQNYRRHIDSSVQYLRTLENHSDNYPHIHAILQFKSASVKVENLRYFENSFFQRCKSTWGYGYTDFQVPRSTGSSAIQYVLKYIVKNSTSKTVWKKILSNAPTAQSRSKTSPQETTANVDIHPPAATKDISLPTTLPTIGKNPTHSHGVKLCSWSRGFDFTPFISIPR